MPLPRPAPGELKWWILGSIGIAIGVALAVWWGLAATIGKPSWQMFGSTVVDDRTTVVTFDVSRPDGRPLICTVQALAIDFSVVGAIEFEVPQSTTDATRETATVRTTSRAVNGDVRTCRFADTPS